MVFYCTGVQVNNKSVKGTICHAPASGIPSAELISLVLHGAELTQKLTDRGRIIVRARWFVALRCGGSSCRVSV